MLRLPLRLFSSFTKRLNSPHTYTTQIPSFPTPRYLIGNIINNRYLNQNWKQLMPKPVSIAGWVRNVRVSNKVMFINLFDGTAVKEVQIVIDREHPEWEKYGEIKKGYSLKLDGMIKEIVGKKQDGQGYEIFVGKEQGIQILGECDPAKYVLSAKYIKPQTVRDYLHLRAKTLRMSAISRIRNTLSFATHTFYQQNGFLYLHTPIITTSDCEGAGEMFHVTTLFNDKQLQKTKDKELDFTKDFFKRSAGLTVSGQLAAETFCCGMSKVYTFGPTFRAEVSNTTRHVAEFWMIEPEFAFSDLFDAMDLAESYVRSVVSAVIDQNRQDVLYLESRRETKDSASMLDILKSKVSQFKRITYTDAIQLLQNSTHKFQNPVQWGCDLSSQHQRYLCQQITKFPTFVYNYPATIKPFYMRLNDDGKTVASFDLLVPGIGEIIGGSQRQERTEYLERRMNEMKIGKQGLEWYLDLRRFGTIPHSGFGVGFDRLVMFCTETENIRDVVPFPRTPGRADC